MFTIKDIKAAHSKVKTGADFPAYVQELIHLGIRDYKTLVSDGHTEYTGKNDFTIQSPAMDDIFQIAGQGDPETFLKDLRTHQEGKTDFPTFRSDCAKSGVEKWVVNISKMTCTYSDRSNRIMLVEEIPGA
jgi:uncharacterized protein YbcV (DUF1398 family)